MKSQFDKITFGGKEGGGMFLKTPFLLRFLANLANFVPPIIILPCDEKNGRSSFSDWNPNEDGVSIANIVFSMNGPIFS